MSGGALDEAPPDIGANIAAVQARVEAACAECGRADRPLLIAVSKEKPLALVLQGLEAGHRDFGENYVQELSDKAKEAAGAPVRWHFIGALQSNKCRMLAACPNLAMVHTVPSAKTARKLDAACKELRPEPLEVMVQVNTSSEESKGGVEPADAPELCMVVATECPNLRLRGLMCIGRYTAPPGTEDFQTLAAARDQAAERLRAAGVDGADSLGLSMGMSHDFEHACRHGASHVRVGSTIFGLRSRGPAFEAAKAAKAAAAAAEGAPQPPAPA
eukprot:TRINITY_DN8644_c0_g1_i1.p1 TRINITY_DN8644_c0_g1~~TRINITY_DN8644_c0_g1_i1.p1  ORF type:complete len:273 (+),score=96.36 TRINITY_DN8644_c0_g1_i1:184-1002(+)